MHPTDKQAEFIRFAEANRSKPIAWLGTVRAGKSIGGMMALLDHMERHPGIYFVSAASNTNVEANLWPNFIRILQSKGLSFDERRWGGRHIHTPYGKVFFLLAHDAGSRKTVQGITFNGGLSDEILLYPRNFIMELIGRFSLDDPLWIMTANKAVPNHWIKVDWIDNGYVHTFESDYSDNPHISETAKEWWKNLITGSDRKRMLENEWASDLGMIGNPHVGKPRIAKGKGTRHAYSIWVDDARNSAIAELRATKNRCEVRHITSDMDQAALRIFVRDARVTCYTNLTKENSVLLRGKVANFTPNVDKYARFLAHNCETLLVNSELERVVADFRRWAWVQSGQTDTTFQPDQTSPEVLACVQGFYHLMRVATPFPIRRAA